MCLEQARYFHAIRGERSVMLWWRGGSVGRASDSRSKDWRFEPRLRQEQKQKIVSFSRVKNVVLTRCRCAQKWLRTHVKDPAVHVIQKHEKIQHALAGLVCWLALLLRCCSLTHVSWPEFPDNKVFFYKTVTPTYYTARLMGVWFAQIYGNDQSAVLFNSSIIHFVYFSVFATLISNTLLLPYGKSRAP